MPASAGRVGGVGYRLIDTDPDPGDVRHVTFVPFLPDATCAAIPGPVRLPSGPVLPGEHYLLDTSLRIPLQQAGFRFQRVHPVAVDGSHLYVWLDGDRYRGRRPHAAVQLVTGAPARIAALLADRPDEARAVTDAAASFAGQCDESWFSDSAHLLEPAYLRAATPEGGSGFGGTAERWRARRIGVLSGVTRSGTFLDLGCANGLLMQSVHAWAAERGLDLEPYGVDLAPGLVELARRRLPAWADRITVGNALQVRTDRRFTYVHLLLDLVPRHRRAELVRHALTLVEPGGRLLVSHYLHEGSTDDPVAAQLAELGLPADGVDGQGETAWIDAA